jgi:hypothetical protein
VQRGHVLQDRDGWACELSFGNFRVRKWQREKIGGVAGETEAADGLGVG